jgi:D-glycero-D-manno-heptose 1,7-bisphosphate phosphatase
MKKRALFLDRDGVINEDLNYVHRIEDFHFVEGIFNLLREVQEQAYLLIVITNQAGIARGYYSEDDFHQLSQWMKARLEEEDIHLDAIYYCPYHPEHGIGKYRKKSDCRKPAPGMILEACRDFDIDLQASALIGDKDSDIAAGQQAGVGTNILFGPEALSREKARSVFTISRLEEAKRLILQTA